MIEERSLGVKPTMPLAQGRGIVGGEAEYLSERQILNFGEIKVFILFIPNLCLGTYLVKC